MEEDDDECGGGFLELLGCDDAAFDKRLTQLQQEFLFSPPLSTSVAVFSPQMLHFGGGGAAGGPHDEELLATAAAAAANEGSRGAKKLEINGGGKRGATVATNSIRRPRGGPTGMIKVRKEKLGDRISTLQQLVSPYGKTDTANVLHEAIGYIRFLHDQVQVLSSPYIHQLPLSNHHQNEELRGGDLRSRGLCLVPISCTENVANNNIVGADLWSPVSVRGSSGSSSGSKH
uniref:BHLH transcription factor n=1 Tax=Dracaena cambodiana TaxID=580341 RepID=A0A7M3UQI8_9ASPA|nr:bHLH transcription factor [Dracaena cambodiana]